MLKLSGRGPIGKFEDQHSWRATILGQIDPFDYRYALRTKPSRGAKLGKINCMTRMDAHALKWILRRALLWMERGDLRRHRNELTQKERLAFAGMLRERVDALQRLQEKEEIWR